ncbi:ABC transporter ATP-binding protein [Sulfurospirillum barnesii]|uniref:ABC-type antimicrobial peptide transport system, ATPase component n=1 Tax=Sulfurospirillum barnesii (strain ATCC 700032 / DSM 10660 / SES-3) TaxID=760154 RepID=I3XVU1_SULBS|nr:ABC transporter ATP-binding protein [Sulfurospirillum barnesii]AFL68065.1 ABC-type antimicrobial peptide transport system, ATPase component [Sulfurospirillum barnesii SES-3]
MKQMILKNVNKIYNASKENAFYALKQIDMEIEKGEIVILKGVSGSGKSTLLSLMGGLSKPSSGDIVVEEENIAKLPDILSSHYRHEKVGFIFQSFNLLNGLTVEQNVIAPLMLKKLSPTQMNEKVNYALEIANISHKKSQCVANLSGGEKQRCAIARAMVMNPPIILADEPTANLDTQNSRMFIEILDTFKAMGKTVVIATHDILFEEAHSIDRYIHMKDGEIIA